MLLRVSVPSFPWWNILRVQQKHVRVQVCVHVSLLPPVSSHLPLHLMKDTQSDAKHGGTSDKSTELACDLGRR